MDETSPPREARTMPRPDEKAALSPEPHQHRHRHRHRSQQSSRERRPGVVEDPDGARRVRQALEEAAVRNSELLATLSATEEAIGALQQAERHLIVLQDEITQQQQIVHDLSSSAQSNLEAHRSYRNALGKLRRLYYEFKGKRAAFQERASKAENAYFESLRTKADVEGREKVLQLDLVEVKAENERLSRAVKEHGATHEAIDSLYASIFDGRTPGFPDEDELEWEYRRATREYESAAKSLREAAFVRKTLAQLKRSVVLAGDQASAARVEVLHSIFNYTGAAVWFIRCAKYIERAVKLNDEAIEAPGSSKHADVHKAHSIIAQNLSAALQAANGVRNPALVDEESGIEAADTITARLEIASDAMDEIYAIIKPQGSLVEQAVKDTARALEDSRQALQEIRQSAFEITVGFGAAAPAYLECCDRAAGFEGEAFAHCERVEVESVDDIEGLPPPPSYEHVQERDAAAV